jgi:hypothetical protein
MRTTGIRIRDHCPSEHACQPEGKFLSSSVMAATSQSHGCGLLCMDDEFPVQIECIRYVEPALVVPADRDHRRADPRAYRAKTVAFWRARKGTLCAARDELLPQVAVDTVECCVELVTRSSFLKIRPASGQPASNTGYWNDGGPCAEHCSFLFLRSFVVT